MKCKRTGILRSEEIAVSPNFKQNVKSFGEQQEDIIILLICVNVMLIICCSRERRSCIAFVQIHFAMNTLVKKKVFTILLHYYPSPSGLWRVGRVHLLGEHRSRLFRSSSCSSRCYLLHLWHRKLSLVLFRNKSLV